MSPFVEISKSSLESMVVDRSEVPNIYLSGRWIVRKIFWLRLRWIHRLAKDYADLDRSCLDFGANGGFFLPTLSKLFPRVVAIDLHTKEAASLIDQFELDNISLVEGDVTRTTLEEAPFGAVVAADVLEHFQDLAPPVAALRRWVSDDGFLFTSLPAENAIYRGLRLIFGITKPEDHYHTGYEVERFLKRNGFRRVRRWFVPLRLRIAPLFLVSAWRKDSSFEPDAA